MKIAAIVIAVALVISFIVFQGVGNSADNSSVAAVSRDASPSDSYSYSTATTDHALHQRVAALEQQVQLLLDSRSSLSPLSSNSSRGIDESDLAEEPTELEPAISPRNQREVALRVERLEEAGFPSDQAAFIVRREQEMQITQLNERWDRMRANYLEDPERYDLASNNVLRRELGERDYERYLEANGRATSVPVMQLFDGSPAAYAGVQPGDQIIAYDGERIFNLRELNQVSVRGDKGEPVLIDVMRNGSRLQLAIDRGPLGISVRRGRQGF